MFMNDSLFRACYTLKCRGSKGLHESIGFLEETIETLKKRKCANIEESTLLMCFSQIDIFESHTSEDQTNLRIQNQSKLEILEAFLNHCEELKEKMMKWLLNMGIM